MKTSDSTAKLSAALVAAQAEIGHAAKSSVNPHFKSRYADLGAVIDAIKPAMVKQGLGWVQLPAPAENGFLALSTRLFHASGEFIEETATCPLQKSDPQGFGSAMTYLRRYSLAAMVGLYQDDDDAEAATKRPEKPAATFQIDRIKALILDETLGVKIKGALTGWGVDTSTLAGLTSRQAESIISRANELTEKK